MNLKKHRHYLILNSYGKIPKCDGVRVGVTVVATAARNNISVQLYLRFIEELHPNKNRHTRGYL